MAKLSEEAGAALWREVFGETPAPAAEDLLARLVENLPEVGYSRFTRPALNDSNLVWPEPRTRRTP